MQFSKEFIEQVRAGNPIVDVVGSYVPLTRKQNNYWACCPFHEEKTPSFSVSPDKEFFYCFGCHAGGDVFQFVQKIENSQNGFIAGRARAGRRAATVI